MRRAGARRSGNRGRGLLVRVGVASVAAGSAGLTLILGLCTWMLHGGEPADAGARAAAPGLSVFGTIHPQLINYGSRTLQADAATFASRFAPATADKESDTPTTTASLPSSSFDDRFSFKPSSASTRSLRPTISFSDRFAGAIAAGAAPARFALASASVAPVAPVAMPAPASPPAPAAASVPAAPHAAARALAARVAPKRQPAATYQVASIGDTPIRTAYASVDSASKDPGIDDSPLLKKMTPRDPAPKDGATGPDMSRTAVYDLTAHVVYLPNGRRLEAHSGLGDHMDDLRSVSMRMLGPTPPGVYDLTMRESLFHGVEAIRLNPV